MSKHEQQLKDAFIHDLKAPDQYDALAKKLEIKRSPKHTHYMKKPFFTKPRLIVAMSSFLLLIAGFIAFNLVSVNAGVPVYKGMEVESVTQVSSAYALEEVSEPFIDEIESGLVPETTEGISYYAEQGETILVKVNMENPNNHIILSFTLNGFMYQDLDFNEGPELNGIIQIIVEFRVANASGIQNITIDAIKYIDSDDDNAIKDAIFDADRTIQVGILYDEIPEILEVSETIAATSFTLDFTLTDPSSLSVDTAFLYVFDGTNIMYTQPVSIGANSFVVSDLMMGHAYEYAITTLFDPLDGVGARLFVLNQGILETLHGVTPSVTSTKEGVSSTLVTLEGVSITTVSLYLNDTLVSNITETNNAYVLEDLLSNTTYELRTTYTYTFNGNPLTQTSIESFTTDAKDIPAVKVLSAVSFGNLVFSTFRVTDIDDTITDLEVRLYKDGDLVQTLDNVTLTPQVANPGTFNASVNLTYSGIGDYLIVVVYTYDLNEGNPLVTVDSLDINADHTLRYEVSREIPELTLNGDSTVTIEVFSTYTELGAVFNDSKDGTGDALISGDTVNTNIVGTYTVLYNYTDTDNNRATQLSRIVNVVDTTAPVITLNGNAEITIEAGAPYNELGAVVTDNYDPDNVAIVGGDTVDTSTVGIYIITYNFTDVNGNIAAEVIRTVAVVDTTAPLITIDGGNTMTLEYLDTFVEPVVTVTDNLDDTRTINGVGTVDTSTLGTYTITYNTTDAEGNVAVEVTLTVTVVDTTAPVITLNGDAEITLQAGATYTELGAVVTDNYDADDIAIIAGDTVDTSTLGTYEVTFNFTDSNNNVAIQVTRTVTVIDTTAPVITLTGDADITIQAGSIYSDQGAIFSDNLDTTGTITIVGDTIDTNILGENTITYNATDSEGNVAAEVTRTVTVIDTTAPVITLTGDADITIQAGSVYTDAGAIFSDNLDTTGTITVVGDDIDTSILGENTITYNATDSEGNVAIEVTRTVTVIDTTPPVITLNGDATITLEVGSNYTELGAVVTDNYDADDIALIGGDTVDTSTLGTYEVTYNFTDSNNNVAVEVTRTVNVVDTTPPVITLNGDATVNIEVGSTYTELGAIVTDNYDADDVALIDGDIVDIDTSILDTYEVTYIFTDSSNNDAVVVTRTVNVVDTTAPVIVVTGGNTITIEAGSLFIPPVVTLTDNYDDDLIITLEGNYDTTINPLVPGTYTITYNKDDSSGNQAAEVIVTVTITDTTIPVITLEGSATVTIEAGSTYEDLGVTITDNALVVGNATVSNTVDTSVLGTYTITYDYTDPSGNAAAQVSRTVEVIDTTPPAITLNGDDEITIQAGSFYTDAGAIFSDNLDTTGTITVAGDTVDTSVLGDYTITFDAVDTEGNNAIQVTRTVTVVDTTAPVIVITGGNTLNIELNATFTEPVVTLTDNYDADVDLRTTGTLSATIDTSILDAVYTITYSGTDSLGNVAEPVILTITIVDTTAPTADPISTQSYEVKSAPVDFTTLITNASDNATATNNLVITETNNVDFDNVGQYEAVITVTDEKGNAYAQTVTINIVDTTAPVIVITGGNTITLDYLETFVEPEVTLTDNYDVDTSLKGLGNFSGLLDNTNVGGNYTLTYDAQDLNGNGAVTVILTIQIRDISAPTFDTITDETIQAGTNDIDWTTRMVNVVDTYDDAVSNTITLTEVTDNVNYNVVGTYTVTVKATDTSGNETSQTLNVTVEDTTVPVISLNGSPSMSVEAGTLFTDPGVVITDNVAVGNVVVGGDTVDPNSPDTYTITYDYSDPSSNAATQVTRTVIVADTIAPVITLNGDATIYLTVNVDTYDESLLGATATDSFDGNLGTITDTVYTPAMDTTTTGTYFVDYSISDAAGNSSTVRRTVIIQDPPGSSNNPNEISTTQQFIDFFNYNRSLVNNFNKEYFILMNDLDFQNAQLPQLELLGHLDGNGYTISNVIVSSSSASSIGFFRTMNTASLKDITFDNIEFNNQTTYTSSSIDAGLLFGTIESQSGTNIIDNVTISNSSLIYNTTTTGRVGLIAGLVKNATISNITLSNNSVEYRSSYAAPEHWYQGFMFGHNGGTVTLSSISGTSNKLFHSQGDASTNAPGVIIGYALAKSSFSSYLTLSNISLTVSIYLKTTGSRTWLFGHYGASNTPELVSSNVTVSTSVLNISSY